MIRISYFFQDMMVYTLLSLLCWQFSQFVFATQLFALLILKWFKIIPNELYLKLSLMHAIPVGVFIFWTQSNLLLCSLYTCMLFSSNFCSLLSSKMPQAIALFFEINGTFFLTQFLKFVLLNSNDDGHVFDILLSKLTNYKNFHTMLYTCSTEFDFLQFETYESIIRTMLLPTVTLSVILILYYWYRSFKKYGLPNCIEMDVAYNLLQTGAFTIMAVFIMRLKLFMTPHLCIMSSLVASKRYLERIEIRHQYSRLSVIILLFASMSFTGVQHIYKEHGFIGTKILSSYKINRNIKLEKRKPFLDYSVSGEYSNTEQEQLLDWIQTHTPPNAVFAGKMSLMANIMLSTRRPIVNNPYYEDKEMRSVDRRIE